MRTRKVVGFRNSALTPWGVLACSMGYGDQGIDMILDGVENRANDPAGWTDWKASTPTGASGIRRNRRKRRRLAEIPVVVRVELAVEMVNECIDDMSEKSATVAAKWATGTVPVAEMITLNAEFAARLATDPLRFLERLRNPARGGDK